MFWRLVGRVAGTIKSVAGTIKSKDRHALCQAKAAAANLNLEILRGRHSQTTGLRLVNTAAQLYEILNWLDRDPIYKPPAGMKCILEVLRPVTLAA